MDRRNLNQIFDFSAFITDRAKNFTGREWVFDEIQEWLANTNAPNFFIIVGEPGIGKSAIAARLTQVRKLAAHHFCIARQADTIDPFLFARSLSRQLCEIDGFAASILENSNIDLKVEQHILQNYGDVIGAKIENLVINAPSSTLAFTHAVIQPLKSLMTRVDIGSDMVAELKAGQVSSGLHKRLLERNIVLTAQATISEDEVGSQWTVSDGDKKYHICSEHESLNAYIHKDGHAHRIILVDSLDEAAQHQDTDSIVKLLANVGNLPKQLRLILTTRPDEDVLGHFDARGVPYFLFDASRWENYADICKYIRDQLTANSDLRKRLAESEVEDESFVMQVATASEGNFLYVVLLLQAIANGSQPFDATGVLPQGLSGIYREFLLTRRVSDDKTIWRKQYRPVLGVLAAAREPLTAEQLEWLTDLDGQEISDVLGDVQQFLDPVPAQEGRYQLYHQSLIDFLTNKKYAGNQFIDPLAIHKTIVDHILSELQAGKKKDWLEVDEYGLLYLPFHMLSAKAYGQVANLLTNFDFVEARVSKTSIDKLLADLQSVLRHQDKLTGTDVLLRSMHKVLESKTFSLQNWDSKTQPGLFLGKIYLWAVRMKESPLIKLCEERLGGSDKPYLQYQWISAYESPELEHTLVGHSNPIVDLEITPDGTRIVSQTDVNEVKVWELETGQEIQLVGYYSPIDTWDRFPTKVVFTQDSRHVIIEHSKYYLSTWDLETGKEVNSIHISSPRSWGSNDKSSMWRIGECNMLHWTGARCAILDINSFELQRTLDVPAEAIAYNTVTVVTPDGRYVIYGTGDGAVHIWDIADEKQSRLLRESGSTIRSMSITNNGLWLALTDKDKTLQVWNLQNGSLKWTMSLKSGATFDPTFIVTPEGNRAIFGHHDFSVRIWDLDENRLERTLRGHSARVSAIAVTADGRRIVSGADDGTVRIWNISEAVKTSPDSTRHETGSHAARVTALGVTPDGKYALSGSVDGVKVWNIGTGIVAQMFGKQNGWVDNITLLADGHQFVVLSSLGYGRNGLTTIDASDQFNVKASRTYQWDGVRTIDFFHVPTFQEIIALRIRTGDTKDSRIQERDPIYGINQFCEQTTWTPVILKEDEDDEGYLSYASHEGGPARKMHGLAEFTDLIAQRILASDDGKIIYFDRAADGFFAQQWIYYVEQPRTYNFKYSGKMRLRGVTPDGRYLILALVDGQLIVFDLQTGEVQASFKEHKAEVYDVAVAPDGRTVISISEDGQIFVWDILTAEQIRSHRFTIKDENGTITPLRPESTTITHDNQRALFAIPGNRIVEVPICTDEAEGIQVLAGHSDITNDIAISQDNRLVLSASEDCTVKVWSLQSGQQLASAMLEHPAQKAVFTPDGNTIVAGDSAGNVYCLRLLESGT